MCHKLFLAWLLRSTHVTLGANVLPLYNSPCDALKGMQNQPCKRKRFHSLLQYNLEAFLNCKLLIQVGSGVTATVLALLQGRWQRAFTIYHSILPPHAQQGLEKGLWKNIKASTAIYPAHSAIKAKQVARCKDFHSDTICCKHRLSWKVWLQAYGHPSKVPCKKAPCSCDWLNAGF